MPNMFAAKGMRRPSGPIMWNRRSDQARGLRAWWPFMNPTPNIDIVGRRNTNVAHYYQLAKPLMGVTLVGGSTFIITAADTDTALFDAIGAFTVSCWYMPSGGANYGIFTRWAASVGWMMYQPTAGSALRGYVGGTNINGTTLISDQNRYYFVAMTYDGTTLRLYVDGVEEANGAASPSTSGGGFICFGNYSNAGIGGQGATVADARWYPGVCKSPIQMWDMYDPRTRWEMYLAPGRRESREAVVAGSSSALLPMMMESH